MILFTALVINDFFLDRSRAKVLVKSPHKLNFLVDLVKNGSEVDRESIA
jgi:hypothetical protein